MGITRRRAMKEKKARAEKKKKMVQKLTPMQIVKRDFESKMALVEKILPSLERVGEETDEEFKARVFKMSNSKLLKLHKITTEVKEQFETKDKLVEAVYNKVHNPEHKMDQDYYNKLKTFSMGRLLDMVKFYNRSK